MIIESFMSFMNKIMLFSAYVNNVSNFPKPLSVEKEQEYFEKFWAGDKKAKEVLISHNLRLVAHIVKKYNASGEADDLISVGSIGLIKAINTFKYGKNTQFSTYAARCIENEILMLLRVNKKHKNTISIEEALGADSEENELAIIDVMFESDNVEEMVSNSIISEKLEEKLKQVLTKREYVIICLRYGLNGNPALTQREVANKLKISRSYISRLEKKAIDTIRANINKKDYY